ncbi:uncharacterized protein LOC121315198 [Polyodon spathula]|uniref:uncharacterized protein LOC121315198 n=1 Tax=Polyodon spathula TaxID=7913 RepID=UPI001B7ECC15|nr:uncharacterized protein LOC121315198 [Polyodon spathula]
MVAGMLMPLEKLRAIYELLFRDGVLVAKKDKCPQSLHPEVPELTNLQVMRAMGSLKSRGYVRETFAWRHFYWYLTNEGIIYLRDYLHLPPEIVPSSLQRVRRPASTLDVTRRTTRVQTVEGPTSYAPKPSSRAGAEGLDSLMDRQGYRRKKVAVEEEEMKTQKVSAASAFHPPCEPHTSKPASAAEGSASFMDRQSSHKEKVVVVQETLQTKKVSAGRGSQKAPKTHTSKPSEWGTEDQVSLMDHQGDRKEVTVIQETITVHSSVGAITKKASAVSVSQEAPKLHANKQPLRANAKAPALVSHQETLKKEVKVLEEKNKVQKSSLKYSRNTPEPCLGAGVRDRQEPLKKEVKEAEKKMKVQQGSLKHAPPPPGSATPKSSSGADAESPASMLEGQGPPIKDVKVEEEHIKTQKSSMKASQPLPKLGSPKSASTEAPAPVLDQEPLKKEVKIAEENTTVEKSSVKECQPKPVAPKTSLGAGPNSILIKNDMTVVEENILIQNVTIVKNKKLFTKTETRETTELYTLKPKSEAPSASTEDQWSCVEKIQVQKVSAVSETQQAPEPSGPSKPSLGAEQAYSKPSLGAEQAASKPSLGAEQAASKPSLGAEQAASKPSLGAEQAASKPSLGAEQAASKPLLGAGSEVPSSISHHQEQDLIGLEEVQEMTGMGGSEMNPEPITVEGL